MKWHVIYSNSKLLQKEYGITAEYSGKHNISGQVGTNGTNFGDSCETNFEDWLSDDELYQALEKAEKKNPQFKDLCNLRIFGREGYVIPSNGKEDCKYIIDNEECLNILIEKNFDQHDDNIILIYGILFGDNNSRLKLDVAAVFQRKFSREFQDKSNPEVKYIKTGVYGLDRILFPGTSAEERGFEHPQKVSQTVPQIVLIKGAPGTGKTTLAIQMLVEMASSGMHCMFWSTNNDEKSIKDIINDFEFCSEETFERFINDKNHPNVIIEYIKQKPITELKITKLKYISISYLPNNTDVLFIDSINLAQGDITREQIWDLFDNYRKQKIIAFVFLEDYGNEATAEIRQLIVDCEFFADIVIQLSEVERMGYQTFNIKIKKKHFGSQSYGNHLYKIYNSKYRLFNLENFADESDAKKYNTTGIVVFPSVARYLSGTREIPINFEKDQYVQTGITHLDEILQGGPNKGLTPLSMPPDSCVVIRGEKGCHKLTLGINLLLGGMWKVTEKKVEKNKDVLLILLNEESNIDIKKTAIAKFTHLSLTESQLVSDISDLKTLDNGAWIEWIDQKDNECKGNKKCRWYSLFKVESQQKILFKKYCAKIKGTEDHSKLVIAGFRSGFITPEEFLYTIWRLINPKNQSDESAFSRVLFVSTDHLKMRFPLLYQEKLLLPTLVDMLKSRGILSILIDVIGKGSDQELTYGLSGFSDYLIRMEEVLLKGEKGSHLDLKFEDDKGVIASKPINLNQEHFCTKMLFDNIRGKNYSRPAHLVTVNSVNNSNSLYLLDNI